MMNRPIHIDSTEATDQKSMISRLRQEMLLLQGFKTRTGIPSENFGLGPIEAAFPNETFPCGTIHEFLSETPEYAAATGGFISALLSVLMQTGKTCVWISRSRSLFPPALHSFGIEPDQIIFIDLKTEKDILWVAEEALRCGALTAVIAELGAISFAQSRRLQLAVEKSKVTGFILKSDPSKVSPTTFAARWKIRPLSSEAETGMPGVGFPRWNIELLKVRNGYPGNWKLEWSGMRFNQITTYSGTTSIRDQKRKAG